MSNHLSRRHLVVASLVISAGCSGATDVVHSRDAGPRPEAGVTSATPTSSTTVSTPPSSTGSSAALVGDQAPGTQIGSGEPVTLIFGGDIHFDGPLAQRLASDPAAILGGLQPLVSEADIAVVNLETAIGSGGDKAAKAFNFRAPPTAFGALTDAGVDVIAMANNHALDYGQSGLTETLNAAAALGAPVIGIGRNEAEALAPARFEVKGQRIAIINATDVLDANLMASWTATPDHPGVASAKRVDSLVAAVRAARSDSDTVVVFLHWGTEKTFCANDSQRSLAPKLVEAGADIIVGGHAHRVLGGGFIGHSFVGYGLGNLVFKTSSADARETGLMRITATGRRIDAAEWVPARIGADFVPKFRVGADRDSAFAAWDARRGCSDLSTIPALAP